MKRQYKEIRIEPHTKAWHKFRECGYGASEISGVLAAYDDNIAQETWNDPLKIHCHKIFEPITEFTGNESSEGGHFMEPIIVNMTRHYDLERADGEHMFRNLNRRFGKPKIYNRLISRKVYVQRPDVPWLFASPDSIGYAGNKRFCVECKNTTSMEANKYANRVSPSFISQVMQVLFITGWDYALISVFIDGKHLEVFPVYPNKDFFDWIYESSKESWLNVEKARAIKKEFNIDKYYGIHPNFINPNHHEAIGMLQQLEPDFTGATAQHNFITEHIIPTYTKTEREMSQAEWDLTVELVSFDEPIKKLAKEVGILKDKLVVNLGGYHKAISSDGDNCYISYAPDKNGKCSLRVSDKLKQLIKS